MVKLETPSKKTNIKVECPHKSLCKWVALQKINEHLLTSQIDGIIILVAKIFSLFCALLYVLMCFAYIYFLVAVALI